MYQGRDRRYLNIKIGKVNMSNPRYLDRKKERRPHLMVVKYYRMMHMEDYRRKLPLALMHNRTRERGVRGDMVAYLYTNIPIWLDVRKIKCFCGESHLCEI